MMMGWIGGSATIRVLAVATLLLWAASGWAAVTMDELPAAVAAAAPGDTIVLKDGTYATNVRLNLAAHGRSDAPITLCPETPGGVTIKASDGSPSIVFTGSFWTVEGVNFDFCVDGILDFNGGTDNTVRQCRFFNTWRSVWLRNGASRNRLESNTFEKTAGHLINFRGTGRGEPCADNVIERNLFVHNWRTNLVLIGENGEPDRKDMQSVRGTRFEQNYVAHVRESYKGGVLFLGQGDTIVRDNYFVDNDGGLIVRGNQPTLVEGNIFLNTRGLDVMGAGHTVRNNYFQGNNPGMIGDYAPAVMLRSGESIGEPGTVGWRDAAADATIENNTIIDWRAVNTCGDLNIGEGHLRWGWDSARKTWVEYATWPKNTRVVNNMILDHTTATAGPAISVAAPSGVTWQENVAYARNLGDIPLSGMHLANTRELAIEKAPDGTHRSTSSPNVGFQGSSAPLHPSDAGATWVANSFNRPPVARWEADKWPFVSGVAPFTVSFNGAQSEDRDGTIASYGWDFGDGSDGTGVTPPPHEYRLPGIYTVVLTVTDDDKATSKTAATVTVEAPGEGTKLTASIAALPASRSPLLEHRMSVRWSAVAPLHPDDWIGLFKKGDPSDDAHLAGGQWKCTNGQPKGIWDMTAVVPGQYEVRYFRAGGWELVATSNPIAVGTWLTATPSLISPNQKVTVAWNAVAPRYDDDWIAMFPDDEVDDFNPVGGQWMFTQSAPTGLWEVVGPSVPGSYQAEYRASGGFDDPEGVSNRIIVVAPGGATLSASPELVGPGETVVVSWDTPGRPDAQDRIGFFRKGDPSDDQHLIDTWHDTRGQSRGSVEISAPSFGAYEARYFTKAVVEPAACSNVVTAEFRWPGSSGHGTPPHAKTQ